MDANIENELDSQSFAVLERSNSHLTKVFVHDQIKMTAKDVRKQIFWASGGQKGANVIIPTIKELLPGCTRIGKNPSSAFTFFSFIDENSKNEAIARLTKISFRGTQWKVLEPTEEDLDNLHRGHTATKRQRSGQTPEGEKTQTNSIAPWKDIPYVDQLKRKQTHCEAILRQICANIKKWAYRDQQKLPQWLEVKLSQDSKCMCAPFSAVLPSPQTIGYRNQNRFTVGWDNENKPVIGFNTGAARDLHFTVFPVMGVPMVSETSQTLITTVSNWITHFVPHLQPYHKSLKTGFWRSVCIRETTSGEVMLTFQTTSNYTPEFTREKIRSLATDQLAPRVTSLQWQEWDGSCNAASPDLPFTVLSGPAVIHERVTKEQRPFCLSPTSFFQVNTRAAELLLQTIKEEANVSKSKILLDLCCGTGFFGLCFSSDAHWVIGVEMLSSAVEDANRNAVMQGVTNVSFICSKLEHATSEIEKLVEEKKKQYTGAYGDIEIIAIVDPPRSGLHGKVAKWLRSHRSINHLIYISCCQDSLVKDTLSLCKAPTKEFINEPFEPIKSFGVDLFPHTPHVEQVLILRRNSKEA